MQTVRWVSTFAGYMTVVISSALHLGAFNDFDWIHHANCVMSMLPDDDRSISFCQIWCS